MFRTLQQLILTTLFAVFASQASAMFIQPDWYDPTRPGVGTNRYSYCFNDPINCIDPSGNQAETADPDDDPDQTKTSDDSSKPKPKSKIAKAAKKGFGLLGLLKNFWDVAASLEELNNEQNAIYRGLSQRDVDNIRQYNELRPYNLDGNISMEEHALSSEDSQFISLTTNQSVAEQFATGGDDPSNLVAVFDGQQLMYSGKLKFHDLSEYGDAARRNVLNEYEVLYEGALPSLSIRRVYEVPANTGAGFGN